MDSVTLCSRARCVCAWEYIQTRTAMRYLHFVLFSDNEEMIELLIKYGAEIDSREQKYGYTPMHLAVYNSKFSTGFNLFFQLKNNFFLIQLEFTHRFETNSRNADQQKCECKFCGL